MQCYETWTVDRSINRKGRPVTEKYKENEQLIICGVYLLLHIYIYTRTYTKNEGNWKKKMTGFLNILGKSDLSLNFPFDNPVIAL